MKSNAKKALSLFLAVLMCLTVIALDFSSLVTDAEAALWTAGNYEWRIAVNSANDTAGWNSESMTVYGKPTNGTGGETQIASKSNWKIDFKGWRYNSFGLSSDDANKENANCRGLTTSQFPTKVVYSFNIESAWANRNLEFNLYIQVKNSSGNWIDLPVTQTHTQSGQASAQSDCTGTKVHYTINSSFTLKDGTGTVTFTVNSSGLPALNSVKITQDQTDAMTAQVTGSTASTTTGTFTATPYDQYGVVWGVDNTTIAWTQSGLTCANYTINTPAAKSTTVSIKNTTATSARQTCKMKATVTYNGTSKSTEGAGFLVYPTYKITYNVAGNGGTSAVPGPDNTTNTTTSANVSYTIPGGTNYTAKKETGADATGTWNFVGWNGSQSATTGIKPGSAVTVDSYNDTLYAIFSKSATATFYWYNSSGVRTSATNTKTVYNNVTQYTFDVPKASVPATFTADGTTYTFAGWVVDSTTATAAEHASTVTSAAKNIKNGNLTDTYSFYALYTASVTLSYDNNGGSGLPASQTESLTLNCGSAVNVADNLSGRATFTLNPSNVKMTREYSSDFIGWKTAKVDENGVDAETAEYKDGTVTWADSTSLPSTITIAKDTTVYATYYDFRYNVNFYNNTGELLSAQSIRHNFSAAAPAMKTNTADPSHTDSGSHYVFDHWEYTDGAEYKDSDKLNKLVNGYTYEVWGKYVGHKHIWGEPYDMQGATTCTSGSVYKMACTVCGYVRDFEDAPLGHEFELVGVAEPTCTKPGSYGKLVCKNCGAIDPEQTAIIDGVETPVTDDNRIRPALGHDYGVDIENLTDENGSFIVPPKSIEATCTTAGYYYYTCSRCDDELRVGNIPATGHNWDKHEEVPATCTEPGVSAYTVCLNCELYLIEKVILPALNHNTVLVPETDSTCVTKGHYEYYQCLNCGKYYEDAYAATEITDIAIKDRELISHDYQPSEDDIDATCTEDGYIGAYVCTVCGEVDPEHEGTVIKATGHVYNETRVQSLVPCAEPGYTEYVCSKCGDTYREYDELAAHTKGEYIEAVAATCLAEGHTDGYYCSVCGGYYNEPSVLAKLSHEMTTIPGYAVTCTKDGMPDYYKCSLCGFYYLDINGNVKLETEDDGTVKNGQITALPALGHNWTEWVVAVMPTDTENGLEKRRCIRCGEVEERGIEATGHSMIYVPEKAATCTEDGNKAYYECSGCGKYFNDAEGNVELNFSDIFIEAYGHELGEPTAVVPANCAEDGYEEYVCNRCSHTVIVTVPKNNEHPADKVIAYGINLPATCAATGQEAGTMCSLCGTVLTQPKTLPKIPHSPVTAPETAATCTAKGFTGDTYCSVCNQVITRGTVIEAKGHHYGSQVVVSDATCTAYGLKVARCEDCDIGVLYYETPLLGHQVVVDKAVPVTCTEAGLTEGMHCSRCGEVLLAQEEITSLGHNYEETVTEPTCTRVGYTTHTCLYCDDTYTDTYTEKTPHVEDTPATCTSPAVCLNCGRTYGDALGHDYVRNDALSTPSTCVNHGTIVYECARCNATKAETAALGDHSFSEDDVVYVPANCTEAGYVTVICEVCGEILFEETESALGHSFKDGVCEHCGIMDSSNPGGSSTSTKCSKCGLNHNGRTGLWKENGFLCKLIGFFRNLFGLNK